MSQRTIGILRGMETTFPDGLVSFINDEYGGDVRAEFIELGHVATDGDPAYDAILDRISHEVPFYRSYLKWASLRGTYVVNNPFWWSADDKFIDNLIAQAAGVAVPRSLILPHKNHPPNTESTSFRNLKYPLDWDVICAYVGFPCFMKPHDGGGWRGVTRCETPDDVRAAYDASGSDCMMLQEGIEFEDYFRCYGVGRRDVRLMRYNPTAPDARTRYTDTDPSPIAPTMRRRLERDVLALCRVLGYDLNTVEFAVRDGVPYAIDFMNPAPDADYWTVGQESYEWAIRTTGQFLVEMATSDERPSQFPHADVLAALRG